jgi:ubiquitin C-terminal hydrolase
MTSAATAREKIEIAPFGLQNFASVCYFNSLVQMLCGSTRLLDAMAAGGESKTADAAHTFFGSIAKKSYPENVSPLLSAVSALVKKYTIGAQQDAHEGFVALVDNVPELKKLFLMHNNVQILCKACNTQTEPKREEVTCVHVAEHDIANTKSKDIIDFMRGYATALDENYVCTTCSGRGKCYKITRLSAVSDLILVSLNKYISKFSLDCPQTFKLPVDSARGVYYTYVLVGVVEHSGGQNSGHYIAAAVRSGKKYTFNDSAFTAISGDFTINTNTYMLLYERTS